MDDDGHAYSKQQFLEYYGGLSQWDQAPRAMSNMTARLGLALASEKRLANDGGWYTKQQFMNWYGGLAEWEAARSVSLPEVAKMSEREAVRNISLPEIRV